MRGRRHKACGQESEASEKSVPGNLDLLCLSSLRKGVYKNLIKFFVIRDGGF